MFLDLIRKNKVLVVITGISGSGKTTLAKEISKKSGLQVLSVDDYKEFIQNFGRIPLPLQAGDECRFFIDSFNYIIYNKIN